MLMPNIGHNLFNINLYDYYLHWKVTLYAMLMTNVRQSL